MVNPTYHALGAQRSCIRELFEYGNARAAQIGRENVFDYSLGNPSIPAPPEVAQVIGQLLTDMDGLRLHGYTSAQGDLDARSAVAADLNRRYDAAVRPQDLFLGCGAAPELVAVLKALSRPQGEVIAFSPYFPEYRPFTQEAGMRFVPLPPQLPDFGIPMVALEEALNENTVAVILNSPNNPSGVVYSESILKTLSSLLCRKSEQFGHPVYLVSDEPYRELCYDGVQAPFVPLFYENTIVCYSWSKSLSIPGERLGYIYVPQQAHEHENLLAAVAGAARACGHVCAPSLWQKVIARCVHLRPDLQAYDRNRRLLYDNLRAMGYEMAKPDGAFYLFIQAPGGDAKAFSEMAKQKDLLLVPGDGFGCPGYFRICYCVSEDTIVRSLPIFEQLIQEVRQ